MTSPVIVYITTSDYQEAKKIGEEIVKLRLAACANILGNVESLYWWKGDLEKAKERILILKTTKNKVEEIKKQVKKLHSYENPCVIAIPIIEGSEEYLDWIKKEVE